MLSRLMLLVALFGVISLSPLRAQSAFDGKWTAVVTRPAPLPKQNLSFTISTNAGKVTGSIVIEGVGEVQIDWGFVKGDLIALKVKMPFNNMPTTFVYLGKIDGDQISFGRRPEDLTLGQLVEFTAKKGQ